MSEHQVLSVRGSGTRFVCDLLGCKQRIHVDQHPEQLLDLRKTSIVVPLRHPHDVWKSWAKRRSLKDVGTQYAHARANFIRSWELLELLNEEYSFNYFLPIDHPYRDILLWNIDQQLHADWDNKIGESDYNKARLQAYLWHESFDFIYELPFIAEFYSNDRRKFVT